MPIKIRNKSLDIPIIQGAMAIGISNGNLAGAVANRGGIGTLSMVNPGYNEKDFYENPIEANKKAFVKEVKVAREKSRGRGLILTNLMNVVEHKEEYLKFLNTMDIDGVIMGAGLPMDLPKYISKDKLIAPIVSSKRALKLIMKKWQNLNRKPDLVVFEGPEAGGHLGFKEDNLDIDMFSELKNILEFVDRIPVFIGGGFGTVEKVKEALLHGATGVQIGTGFLFTKESGLDLNAKKEILENKNKYKNIILKSPVGLPARGLLNSFVEKAKEINIPPKRCMACIKTCKRANTNYCINEALINAVRGNLDEGLFFSGTDIKNIDKVRTVDEYIDYLRSAYE